MDKKQIEESFSKIVLAVDELRHAVLDTIPDPPTKPAGVIARPFDTVIRKSTGVPMIVATRAAHERRWGGNATRHSSNRAYLLFDYGVDWVSLSDLETRCGNPIIGYEDD